MAEKLGAQHEGIIHAQTQQQEVQIVVEIAVGHSEVAHEAKGASNCQTHDEHCHKGQEHAGMNGITFTDHDRAVKDDHPIRSREFGDVSSDGISELVAERLLEQAAELQQIILRAIQLRLCASVGVHAHEAQGSPLPLVRNRIGDTCGRAVELGLVQREEA